MAERDAISLSDVSTSTTQYRPMRKSCLFAGQSLSRAPTKSSQPSSGQLFSLKLLPSYRQFSSTPLWKSTFNNGPTSNRRNPDIRAVPKKAGVYFYSMPNVRFYGNVRTELTVSPTDKRTPRFRKRWLGGIFLLCLAGATFVLDQYRSESKIFDPPRFTPFTIIKKEVVSPTSIILTLRPQRSPLNESTADIYKERWDHGMWSVEVKQPELQIARSYTPLPPSKPHQNSDLRFLIRKERKGEVSGYLHSLTVGSKIELRGPHPGFDLPEDVAEVIFLAGGTGIAPAMQVAYTLLERRNTSGGQSRIRIVWSNRRRSDCEGGTGQMDNMAWESGRQTGRIVQELEALQQRYPGRLTIEYLVDEENTFLDQRTLSKMTSKSEKSLGLVGTQTGPKLLLISGPEGFINYSAGPKKWEGGKEGQGKVAGLLGQARLKDWIVWKL